VALWTDDLKRQGLFTVIDLEIYLLCYDSHEQVSGPAALPRFGYRIGFAFLPVSYLPSKPQFGHVTRVLLRTGLSFQSPTLRQLEPPGLPPGAHVTSK
jgi:hypothetical protein